MADVFVVDFEQKRVVKSYDTQKEVERRANMKKATEVDHKIYQHIVNNCPSIMSAVKEYQELMAA